jgi:hypothetical protein
LPELRPTDGCLDPPLRSFSNLRALTLRPGCDSPGRCLDAAWLLERLEELTLVAAYPYSLLPLGAQSVSMAPTLAMKLIPSLTLTLDIR